MAGISNFETICRACGKMGSNFDDITKSIHLQGEIISFLDIFNTCTNVQVSINDGLSQKICKKCKIDAGICFTFRKLCEIADKQFREIKNVSYEELESDNDKSSDVLENYSFIKTTDDAEDQTFHCSTCEVEFDTKTDLRKHNLSHEKLHTAADIRTCQQCGHIFQHRSSMLRHQRKHKAVVKKCLHCDFFPQSSAKLAQHMEEKHSILKKYDCPTCNKRFFKETNLKLHLVVHSGVKNHVCEICGKSFALSGNLKAHIRLHTGEKPYTCSHCGKSFPQQCALRSHEASHSDKKDHTCSVCGAAFSRAGALRNHKKRHTNNKTHLCTLCGQAFTFSADLKSHMIIHTGVKNHTCEICGKSFNRNSNLRVHKRIHSGETPYVCNICGKGFTQSHCLRAHINMHEIPVK